MSYTPTSWATGDTVTAEKLNNMETGIEAAVDPFIVTCTPTALDYSGTMDKTSSEIYAAYQAGKKIVFRVLTGASTHVDAECTSIDNAAQRTYPAFNAFIIMQSSNVLIYARVGGTDSPTQNTYLTYIYTLTPAS